MISIRHLALMVPLAATITLTACGSDDSAAPSTAPSSTTSTTTPTTPTSTTPQTIEDTPTPVTEEPAGVTPSAPATPYVTECLQGTPGPAMWSDGTMAYSEDCFQQLGGPAYVNEEGDATARFWEQHPELLNQPTGGDPSAWDYEGPRTDNGDPADHPQLNWPEG